MNARARFLLFWVFVCPLGAQTNETVIENSNPGTTNWQITNPALNREIEGYASLTSINVGGSISLFISTADSSYTMDIFRIGWYGGAGGRELVPTITRPGGLQTTPAPDAYGTFDCNWTNPYVLTIPTNWVSGVYLVKLTAASSGLQSYITFVVREDARASALLFQHSVTTDEAYNNWPGPAAGGRSLYGFNSAGGAGAYKVSFNRPYFIDTDSHNYTQVGAGLFLRWEVMMVRWLEKQGYDVAYCTNVDNHENASLLLTHKAYLSVGHDEYWSWEMRANVESARDHGISVGFFSSNVCYWQIRLESSTATGAADRIIVCYKSTKDPVTNPCLLTVLWRNNTCKPSEQAMIGVEYIEGGVGCPSTTTCTDMVIFDGSSWALAGTGLAAGSHLYGLLGYEVDGELQTDSPPGTQIIAKSPIPIGNSDAQTHPFSEMVTYTAACGATVVAVGTMQWSWGLDDWGAPAQRPSLLNPAVQTITQNVLARLTSSVSIPPGPPVSDDFNTATLNTCLWSFVNPVGNGSYSLTGSELALTVPAGSNHDPTFGGADNAVRVVQSVSNSDFSVELKFDSIPGLQYQFEGLLVEQDAANYLRIQFGSTGSSLLVNASKILSRTETALLSSPISLPSGTTSLWLRLQRAGTTWTVTWSTNGSTYNTLGSFTQALTVADLGPFVGNFNPTASATPAFTALVDYFHNLSPASVPDLTINKSHTGNFTQGQTGATYTIIASNVGTGPTSGMVSVSDTLPAGLTATSIAGTGWSCTQPAGPCTRGDALAIISSYPAITLTVNVASNAASSITNTVTVSGGGEVNTSNDTGSDPTTISASGGGPVSDNFNASTLNTALWTFVNPVGDGSFSMTGSDLQLIVPAGSNHDPTFGGADNAVRVVQSVSNSDFSVELKFDSIPGLQYQFEGLLVEQDSANYLRIQFGSTGSALLIGASKILTNTQTALLSSPISLPNGTTSLWLRVQRAGTTWAITWSANGSTYNTLGSFTQALTVADLAPFVGNYNPTVNLAPRFAALIDYFSNGFSSAAGAPVSDNFDATTLNTSLWTFVNPVGNGSYSVNGSHLLLNVPVGSSHDPAFGGSDNSVRVIQSIGNTDFTVETKFDSIPSLQYQFEGILVEQDSANYLRFQFGSTGSSLVVNASQILSHNETALLSSPVSAGASSFWLRVQKSGATWTVTWSTDGSTYNTLGSFTQGLMSADIGPFVGNFNATVSSAPAFTASVDYFFNTASPLTP